MLKPLALTLGEAAGIGPDITIEAWRRRADLGVPPFYLIGDAGFIEERAKHLGVGLAVANVDPASAAETFADALPVVSLDLVPTAAPGQPDETSARTAIDSIRRAVADVLGGRAAALVTNPISKGVLYRAGFSHPGHTEFLAELAAVDGKRPLPVMMMWSPLLAVTPVTIHVSLRDAIEQLTSELIVKTARVLAADLITRFGIARPRLAFAGLNPHAGEGGSLGHEDQAIIAPAIATLQSDGIDAQGPLAADTMFHAAARKTYDCAVCMYHDQALIPIKTLAFEDGVNVTLGLPFIRTSPDHGTAFGIAGTGAANPSSLVAALKLAARMATAQA